MFRVGQKVVCVKTWSLNGEGRGDEIGPIKNEVYTIRSCGVGLNPAFQKLQVRLVEIKNPTIHYVAGIFEAAFDATRFRPIVERKTDISIFTAMLKTEGAPALTRARAEIAKEPAR